MFANYVYFEQQYFSVMNISSEPLRGAVFGTENTKVLCHDTTIRYPPFSKAVILEHRDDHLSFIDYRGFPL